MKGYFFPDFETGFYRAAGTPEYMVSTVRWMRPLLVVLMVVTVVGTKHAVSYRPYMGETIGSICCSEQ